MMTVIYAANYNDNADYNAYAELLLMWMMRKPTLVRMCLCEPLATSGTEIPPHVDSRLGGMATPPERPIPVKRCLQKEI